MGGYRVDERRETRLPAGGAEFRVGDLLVRPSAFAVQVARAGRWQRAGEDSAEFFITAELGERRGVADVEDAGGARGGEMKMARAASSRWIWLRKRRPSSSMTASPLRNFFKITLRPGP